MQSACQDLLHLLIPTPPCTSRQDQLQPRSYGQPGSQGALKVQVIQHKLALQLVSSQTCIPLLITGTHPYFVPHICLWDLTFAALLGACSPTLHIFL